MLILIVISAIIGWLVGVWLPWYVGILAIIYGVYEANKQEGLAGIVPMVVTLIYTLAFIAGNIYSSKGTIDIFSGISYIFTGGKG